MVAAVGALIVAIITSVLFYFVIINRKLQYSISMTYSYALWYMHVEGATVVLSFSTMKYTSL